MEKCRIDIFDHEDFNYVRMYEAEGLKHSTYDLTTDLLLKKKLFIDGLITHRFPLEQWRTAVRTAKDKRSGAIKVILDFREARETGGRP